MALHATSTTPIHDATASWRGIGAVVPALGPSPAHASHTTLGPAASRSVALAALRDEPEPPKDLDAIGERVAAWFARLRVRRLDHPRAARVLARAAEIRSWSANALRAHADAIGESVATCASPRHQSAEHAIDEGFALATEAIRRVHGFVLHEEQVLAAIAMSRGCCVELATGEGKTVTAALPAAVLAWSRRGVHIVTVNDYLARRDAETTGPALAMLGLSVGVLQESHDPVARRDAYSRDVTYGADKQFIFDFLRDRLAAPLGVRQGALLMGDVLGDPAPWRDRIVQRGLHAAIVDEADSVLIDDSVTPAIISSGAEQGQDQSHVQAAARIARSLRPGHDYTIIERLRQIRLTRQGQAVVAQHASEFSARHAGPRRREALVTQALTALTLYTKGKDYVLRTDKVEIVDRSTGRVLPGRMWELGLHQAIEAKEGVEITGRRTTAARSSYQSYFRRYARLCGMSGTCMEVGPEMWTWYRLPVVRVPTHAPVARTRGRDRVFRSASDKFGAVVARIAQVQQQGQPVLVGTWSIENSEALATRVRDAGMTCMVLNAEHEPSEAQIVARAGDVGAITVATNMAGRGTDIRLDPRARDVGGLLVIATERHDERRVDRQLVGRAGRQGDPGRSEAFISLDDQLILSHGFGPLRWLVARTRGPVRDALAWVLWRIAQANASRSWRTHRSDAAKAAAWHDKALHHVTR